MQFKKEDINQATSEIRKLYRSKIDRIFAGVCGGLAEYFNVDVTIVRAITLVLFFFKGIGLFSYLICLIVMKENPHQNAADRKKQQNTALYWGIGLIMLGLSLLPHWRWRYWTLNPFDWDWFDFWFLDWDIFWPVLIILFGILYLFHVLRQGEEDKTTDKEAAKIYRSRTEKVIGGVCGGIAAHLKVDPAIVRFGWIVFSIATKLMVGIFIYILCLIVFKEQPLIAEAEESVKPTPSVIAPAKRPKRVKTMKDKDDSE